MEKNPHTPAKKLDVHSARRLIFILAVSSTLGFWAVVSRVNQSLSVQAKDGSQPAGGVPPLQSENQFVIDLPPLPTLVPTLEASAVRLSQSPVVVQNQTVSVKPSLSFSGKILMGGAKPSAGGSQSITITTTGSSK